MIKGVTITLDELLALRHVANQLQLPQNKASSHTQRGGYPSPFRGRGMDFLETRIYQPGDDIRTINWAVTARTGKPHTKIYEQERERPIYIVVDFKPSMFFGTKKAFKSVVAAYTAAVIAWAALKNGDRVGGLLLKDRCYLLPPSQRKVNLVEFFKHLISFVRPEYNEIMDYPSAFLQLRKVIRSGSLIYFLSDFYAFDDFLERELQQLSKHHDVANIFIYDELEKNLPPNGRYLFHDAVKADSLLIDTHYSRLREQYSDLFYQRLNKIKKLSFAAGMQFAELSTHENQELPLHQWKLLIRYINESVR